MSRNAHKILSFNPLMIKLLPSRNVMLVPVSCTVYFLFENNRVVVFLMVSRIAGRRALPTSAILILMRASCRLLSINEDTSFEKELTVPLVSFLNLRYSTMAGKSNWLGIE